MPSRGSLEFIAESDSLSPREEDTSEMAVEPCPLGIGPLPSFWCLVPSWCEMTGAWLVGGRWWLQHARYRYSSSRACLRASRSAWQDILQNGMLCFLAPCSSSTPSPITM